MKAVRLAGYGGADVLMLDETSDPVPGPEELLIRVYAAALNRADILQRKGKYPPPPGASDILGLEIAGEVVAWGRRVRGFTHGQRVFGLVPGGGYAEYCTLDYQMAMPIPERWDYVTAAAVPEAFLAADEALVQMGALKKGETVLIHAGASGVGSAAVQIARYIGAEVYFTASSQEKIDQVTALCGAIGIKRNTGDFSDVVRQLTNGAGVDVIIDFNGAGYLDKHLRLLKTSGRLVCVGLMGGSRTELDLSLVLAKRLQIKGFTVRQRSLREKRRMTRRFKSRCLPLLEKGLLTPVIDQVFPVNEVRQAHLRMEANLNFGKIILTL